MAAAPSVPLDPWAARHPCGPEHPIFLLIAITCATLESIGSGRGAGAGDEWTNDAETKRRVKIWNARGNIFRRFNGDVGINDVD